MNTRPGALHAPSNVHPAASVHATTNLTPHSHDANTWTWGECWFGCGRTRVPVRWLGPLMSHGESAPLNACVDCLNRLIRQFEGHTARRYLGDTQTIVAAPTPQPAPTTVPAPGLGRHARPRVRTLHVDPAFTTPTAWHRSA